MFEKITKSLTKKTVEVAKKEVTKTVEKKVKSNLPLILTAVTIGATILSLVEPSTKKAIPSSVTIINNYYFGR